MESSTTAMSRHEAITRTPADMLPVELILSILTLTRPCSSVPLASRLLASALDFPPSTATAKSDPSKSICFGWVRRRLAQSTHWTCAGFLHSSPIQPENTRVPCLCVRCVLVELRPAVYWYPSQSAVDSYKGLLPARFKAALCDTWVVRKSFVDDMLCRCYGMDEKQLAEELSLLGSSTGNRVGARYLPESPLLDMLFLAVFYLRSRNVELL
ncbi:hypothetical protein BCR44DRAFT_68382 [Catenaria anguillulae PL171]|uniref:Uncharacterized protein n=1 Tax=Catenaria anguillulae PL171 TaxID=765915 RepID=A0A1Y2HDS8_9FUNG|nr:hypothetical protein BCR44DRAFT_68382 [Catenaria anguillulae PL171]